MKTKVVYLDVLRVTYSFLVWPARLIEWVGSGGGSGSIEPKTSKSCCDELVHHKNLSDGLKNQK